MTRMPKCGRRDANHNELVDYWLSLPGTSWFTTADLPRQLDGVAGLNGIDQRIEIKDGSKPPSATKLTPGEADTFRDWTGRSCIIWYSVSDVAVTWEIMRKELK